MSAPSSESATKAPSPSEPSPAPFPFSGEVKRKALHVLALVLPGGMAVFGKPTVLYGLVPLALLALGADALRSYAPWFNRVIRRIFGPLMRPDELSASGAPMVINGATWVVLSATLLAIVFPVRIAAPALAMFMLADAMAAIIGRRWGRTPWDVEGRTVEGSAAFLITGLTVMACVPTVPFWTGATSVVAACIIEIMPIPVNDNLYGPFAAAAMIALLEWLALGQTMPLV